MSNIDNKLRSYDWVTKFPFWLIIGIILVSVVLIYRVFEISIEKIKGVVTHEQRTDKPALES
jgi:hypothetical protein